MKKTLLVVSAIATVVSFVACEPPEADVAAEPAAGAPEATVAETGPDPVEVDPEHYSVELEGDGFRALRIRYGPGETSVMHYHPRAVAVFLTDQTASFELPDGTTEGVAGDAGLVREAPAGQHLPTNVGDEPFELILVELGDERATGHGAAAGETGADPVEVDPDHYSVELEGDGYRALRIAYGAGETSVMHYHPEAIAVFLTDQSVSFELPDGTTETVDAEAGDVLLTPAGQHLPTNVGDEPFELILVELR